VKTFSCFVFRVDFAAMKEDLAFREDEIEKSKHTLEGLTVQHNQANIIIAFQICKNKVKNLNFTHL
jgi:hypothetical protein